MNGFFIDGNIVGDPKVQPAGEWTVLRFTIANGDDRRKVGEEWVEKTNFLDVEYWTKNPTPWITKIVKGAFCSCAGTIHQDDWEQDGQKRSKKVLKIQGMPSIHLRQKNATSSAQSGASTPPEADDTPF